MRETARRRSHERGDPLLEHPAAAEQRWLEPRASIRDRSDGQQKLSVGGGGAQGGHDSAITVHLDRELEATEQPPQRNVPWHQRNQQRREAEKPGIVRASMLVLVPHHVAALRRGESE